MKPLTKKQKQIVSKNLGLIYFVITHYPTPHSIVMSYEDKFQAGFFGLCRAVQKFDPSKGCKLSTYATRWIFQAIMRFTQSEGYRAVRVPVYMHQKKMHERSEAAIAGMKESLEIENVAPSLIINNHQALKNICAKELRDRLLYVMRRKLSKRDKRIMHYRFGINGIIYTPAKIGNLFHITRQRVHQIIEESLRKMQGMCHNLIEP